MASAITPTVVQKTYQHSTNQRGTPMRLIKYTFKFTKAADGDWLVTATYFQSGTPTHWTACTIDSGSDGVFEGTVGLTYVNTGTELTFSGGTTGTTYGEVWFEA